jgi:hypothetical protein
MRALCFERVKNRWMQGESLLDDARWRHPHFRKCRPCLRLPARLVTRPVEPNAGPQPLSRPVVAGIRGSRTALEGCGPAFGPERAHDRAAESSFDRARRVAPLPCRGRRIRSTDRPVPSEVGPASWSDRSQDRLASELAQGDGSLPATCRVSPGSGLPRSLRAGPGNTGPPPTRALPCPGRTEPSRSVRCSSPKRRAPARWSHP